MSLATLVAGTTPFARRPARNAATAEQGAGTSPPRAAESFHKNTAAQVTAIAPPLPLR
jgi:hypothetical protein